MVPITLTERFASTALSYILENWDAWEFRPDTDKSITFDALKRYLAAGDNGSRTVKYKQSSNGYGRLYADKGLSLQNMVREVRNAIAYPFYTDIDFINCHPTMLAQRCRQRGIECPLLEQYCSNRPQILRTINQNDPAAGKTSVLAVMNGGNVQDTFDCGSAANMASRKWQLKFKKEMIAVTDKLLAPGEPDHKYLKLTKKVTNRKGSALNIMLCDAENNALLAMKEFLESERIGLQVGVLIFDGCLIENSTKCTIEVMEAASDYIYGKTGMRLKIAIKDMTLNMLHVPSHIYAGPPMPSPRYVQDDTTAGYMLLADMENIVASCARRLYVRDGIAWTDDKAAVDAILHKTCLTSNIKQINNEGVVRLYSAVFCKATNIVKTAKALIDDKPEFVKRLWDSNIGVVCFANGLYDFRKGAFFSYPERLDVLPRLFVNRDFPTSRPSPEFLEEVREKLLFSTLGDSERVQTYLETIARATAGEFQDKQWAIMLGERNSGKGLLQNINEIAWGPYVNTIESNTLLLNTFGSDAAKAMSWSIDCEFRRQTYTNELKCDSENKNIKIDGGAIKKFQSGGDPITARKNFEDERTFHTASKLFMNLNDLPPVSPPDALDTALLFKFPFKFVPQEEIDDDNTLAFFRVADPLLKTEYCKRDDVINAFIWLVADAYKKQPVSKGAVVKNDTATFLEDAGDDLTVVRQVFQVTKDVRDFVLTSAINTFAKENGMSKSKIQDRLLRMGALKDNNCCINGISHGRGFIKLNMDTKSLQ
jgi:hypothetical protein